MTPGEWLIVTCMMAATWLLVGLAWFDLSDKLGRLLSLRAEKVVGGYEPMPETFQLTDSEAAVTERMLLEESRVRESMWTHSGRSSRRAS